MVGLESKWDLTREEMMFALLGAVDEVSDRILGLEGRRPRRPLRLSVRTTMREREDFTRLLGQAYVDLTATHCPAGKKWKKRL